jgi:hypothetical protein
MASLSPLSVLLLLAALSLCHAHMCPWLPSMWGQEPGNPNANQAVTPLQDLDFADWVSTFSFLFPKYSFFPFFFFTRISIINTLLYQRISPLNTKN